MAKRDVGKITGTPITYEMPKPAGGVQLETFIPWTLVKRGVRCEIITPIDTAEAFADEAKSERRERRPQPHTALLRALGLAHYWQSLLDQEKYTSIREIAEIEGIDMGQASRIAKLAQLAPELVVRCLGDSQGQFNLDQFVRSAIPDDWSAQCGHSNSG